jgi:hypothetical protein
MFSNQANLSISTEPTPALLRLFLLSFTETDQFKKSITENSRHLVIFIVLKILPCSLFVFFFFNYLRLMRIFIYQQI